jgi:hypothetical protein
MSYNVESLSAYVAENKDVILRDIVFGGEYGDTVHLMTKELGVKGTAKIHPSTIEAVLQEVNGNCGFTPQGELNISEVTIETKNVKVNMEFCLDKLLGKFAEYKIRIGANPDALPFEAEIVEGLVKDIARQVEEGCWAQLGEIAGTNTFTPSGANAYDKVMEVYMKMDERVLEDGMIFVSPAMFRAYVNDLVEKNLYHYNPADGALEDIFIPGSSVKVHKTRGLKSDVMYGTSPKNLVYGTDFMGNEEEVKVWFSDDADAYRVKVRFNYGATFAFPELVAKSSKA